MVEVMLFRHWQDEAARHPILELRQLIDSVRWT